MAFEPELTLVKFCDGFILITESAQTISTSEKAVIAATVFRRDVNGRVEYRIRTPKARSPERYSPAISVASFLFSASVIISIVVLYSIIFYGFCIVNTLSIS